MSDVYTTVRFPNGLRLVMAPMADRYSVAIAAYVGVGSRFESPKQAGSAHFIEHMLFKGTERRPSAEAISEAIETVGGAINASTDKETTVYWIKVARDEVGLAIDLLGDMLLHSTFLSAEIRKEKRVIAEELAMVNDAPQDRIGTLIEEVLWPGHPLGRDIAGTRASVAALSRKGLLEFFQQHYTPHNCVISVAGGIDPEAVQQLVGETFGSWSGGAAPSYQSAPSLQSGPTLKVEKRKTEQSNLCLSLPGLATRDPRRYALDLLNAVLGGGMSSRLFVEVRERQALVYDIHSYTERLDDTGTLTVYAGMDPEAAPRVVQEIRTALRRLREEEISAAELQKVKSQYRGRLLLGLEDTSSVASWIGAQELLLGRVDEAPHIVEQVEAVTAAEIRAIANDLLRDEHLHLAVIGPYKDAGPFEAILRQ